MNIIRILYLYQLHLPNLASHDLNTSEHILAACQLQTSLTKTVGKSREK